MNTLKKTTLLTVVCSLSLAFSGCGQRAVNLQPAEDAANPLCAYAMVAMPETLGGFDQRETTAQGTTAWGEPTVSVLKCGVSLPTAPIADPCASVNGIDWIIKPADEQMAESGEQSATGTWVAETFGRTPALQITFDADQISSSTLLAEIASAVGQIPQQQECTNIDDTLSDIETAESSA